MSPYERFLSSRLRSLKLLHFPSAIRSQNSLVLDYFVLSLCQYLFHFPFPKMKTSIAVSLLVLVAPVFAIPMEALDPRHYSFPQPVISSTLSLPVGPPITHPTGTGFPPFPTPTTHHHKPHKTGGIHHRPTGHQFPHSKPTGTRPHTKHPHPTGGHHGVDRREPEGANGPRYELQINPLL